MDEWEKESNKSRTDDLLKMETGKYVEDRK